MSQPGFFDLDRRLEGLSAKGDPLETINAVVPWESFRAPVEAVTVTKSEDRKSNAGRPGYDTLLKFKMVVLQSLYNLSDEALEFQVRDRLSFMRFLGLELHQLPFQIRRGCGARRRGGGKQCRCDGHGQRVLLELHESPLHGCECLRDVSVKCQMKKESRINERSRPARAVPERWECPA